MVPTSDDDATTAAPGPADAPATATPAAGRRRVRSTRSQVLIAVLCALLGFALVVQVRLAHGDSLSSLRQDDLVRLLDELSLRNEELIHERDVLLAARADLLSGEDSRRVAEEAAAQRAEVQGILAGTLPVEGQGITLRVTDPQGSVQALTLVHVLEELRNAGSEAVEISGQRLTASSWFTDATHGVVVDGSLLTPPYEWIAVGNPQTMAVALDIPGGALAAIRNAGGQANVEQSERVTITAVREVAEPRFATPVPSPTPTP